MIKHTEQSCCVVFTIWIIAAGSSVLDLPPKNKRRLWVMCGSLLEACLLIPVRMRLEQWIAHCSEIKLSSTTRAGAEHVDHAKLL